MMDGSEIRAVDEALSAVCREGIAQLQWRIAGRMLGVDALTDRDLEEMFRNVAGKFAAIADHIAEISADRVNA